MKQVASFAALFTFVSAQGQGNGISKFTKGHSNPELCQNFFNNIMGGSTAPDECPNNVCECATQGRSQICESSSPHPPHSFEQPPPGPSSSSFGAHAINCTYHPYGDMPLSEAEQKVTDQLNWFDYNQHMDSHLGVYTNDLNGYATKLESNNIDNLKFTWTWNHEEYYSILTEACPGFFVELISAKSAAPMFDSIHFRKVEEPRLLLSENIVTASGDSVVKVSRATTRIDEMIDFYETLGGSLQSKEELDDGTIWAIVKMDNAAAELHFVNRPAPEGSTFTVADYEDYMNSVHDKYVKSTNCGFDQYADHHWAYDNPMGSLTLTEAAQKLEEHGYKYRWFGIPGNVYQIYAFDPSGWTFQLDIQTGGTPPSPTATYSAACKSDDGCYGQGLCDDTEEGHFYYATKTWEYFLF